MSGILWPLLFALAGGCVFGILLNRLLLMPDGRFKRLAILAAFGVLVGGAFVAGLRLAATPWRRLPLVVLAAVLAGEGWRIRERRRCAGTFPRGGRPHRGPWPSAVTTTACEVHHYQVVHPKWRGAPLRIAHLSDLHVKADFPADYYRRALALAEAAQPDLVVLTGDFVSQADGLPRLGEVLRPIGRLGTFAVLGNHDYWTDPRAVATVLSGCGIRLLQGESQAVGDLGATLVLTGTEAPWGPAGRPSASNDDPRLQVVLSHTPDNIYRLAEQGADLVFAGHYHAGQARIPGFGPVIIPSRYGRRFDHGHFIVRGTHLFVSSGIGAAAPPLRLFCRPDLFMVEIHAPAT